VADERLFPDNLILQLKQLEDRVRVLESANRLQSGSINDGTSAAPIVVLGGLAPYGIGNGIMSFAADRVHVMLDVNDIEGFGTPWLGHAWFDPAAGNIVTSATFVGVYLTIAEVLWSTQLLFRVGCQTDAGTTGELRLTVSGTGQVGGVKTIPISSNAYFEYRMLHGLTIGSGPYYITLEARRASGAGNFKVFVPGPLNTGANLGVVAGGWV
jgi:hypothetical protein